MEGNRQPWHLARASGGGMLMTAGIHALDRLLGYAGRPAATVSATVDTFFHAQEADDLALMILRFGGNIVGHATSIGFADGAMINADEIVCEKGVIVVDHLGGVRVGRGNCWREAAGSSEPDGAAALVRQWRAFVATVVDGAPLPVTAADGFGVVASIEAAHVSARERREVEIAQATV
jgi:predicted dehydrogenase